MTARRAVFCHLEHVRRILDTHGWTAVRELAGLQAVPGLVPALAQTHVVPQISHLADLTHGVLDGLGSLSEQRRLVPPLHLPPVDAVSQNWKGELAQAPLRARRPGREDHVVKRACGLAPPPILCLLRPILEAQLPPVARVVRREGGDGSRPVPGGAGPDEKQRLVLFRDAPFVVRRAVVWQPGDIASERLGQLPALTVQRALAYVIVVHRGLAAARLIEGVRVAAVDPAEVPARDAGGEPHPVLEGRREPRPRHLISPLDAQHTDAALETPAPAHVILDSSVAYTRVGVVIERDIPVVFHLRTRAIRHGIKGFDVAEGSRPLHIP